MGCAHGYPRELPLSGVREEPIRSHVGSACGEVRSGTSFEKFPSAGHFHRS